MKCWISGGLVAATTWAMAVSPLLAAEPAATIDPAAQKAMVAKAINYLRTQGQAEDGSFSSVAGPGVTALVATGLLRNGLTPADPTVAKALKYIEGFVQEDGGVYSPQGSHRNYETALAVACFSEANKDGRYDQLLKKADAFIKGIQWDESEDQDVSSDNYGGAGYGRHKRPDLSNTSFLIDALKATGNGPDDEAMKKALIFVSRCQNLETEHNTTKWAAKNPDGGFYYTIANGGESQAGEVPGGGLRSYGSMTYAGLKSMIYAGVDKNDPRVQAAYKWIQKNYALDQNPGLGNAGLFYYYHIFAKSLDAMGKPTLEDADGKTHDWKQEIAATLASRQRPDGSWTNDNSRWLEGDANLVTGYALLTLAYCK